MKLKWSIAFIAFSLISAVGLISCSDDDGAAPAVDNSELIMKPIDTDCGTASCI